MRFRPSPQSHPASLGIMAKKPMDIDHQIDKKLSLRHWSRRTLMPRSCVGGWALAVTPRSTGGTPRGLYQFKGMTSTTGVSAWTHRATCTARASRFGGCRRSLWCRAVPWGRGTHERKRGSFVTAPRAMFGDLLKSREEKAVEEFISSNAGKRVLENISGKSGFDELLGVAKDEVVSRHSPGWGGEGSGCKNAATGILFFVPGARFSSASTLSILKV